MSSLTPTVAYKHSLKEHSLFKNCLFSLKMILCSLCLSKSKVLLSAYPKVLISALMPGQAL